MTVSRDSFRRNSAQSMRDRSPDIFQPSVPNFLLLLRRQGRFFQTLPYVRDFRISGTSCGHSNHLDWHQNDARSSLVALTVMSRTNRWSLVGPLDFVGSLGAPMDPLGDLGVRLVPCIPWVPLGCPRGSCGSLGFLGDPLGVLWIPWVPTIRTGKDFGFKQPLRCWAPFSWAFS